jgi:Peptidase A4 family
MIRSGKLLAVAAAAATVVGLAASSASAVPQASASRHPHLVLHGTGGLHPDIRLPRNGRLAATPEGIPIQYSGNWSGYIALPKSGKAKAFRYVQGDYNVPSVNCATTPSAFAYFWVGLDGDTDSTVEQDGVGGYCVSGSPVYFAWSEMFPDGVQIQFYLNPGDEVTSSVYYNSSTRQYELDLTDLTSGQTFSVDQACPTTCDNSSAEVITEGYPSSPYDGTSDYASVNYETIKVTDSAGTHGALTNSNWHTDESIHAGSACPVDTEPGALYSASVPSSPAMSAFEDTWYCED